MHDGQPLLEIRPTNGGNIQIYPLSAQQVGDSRTLFRADFTAARSGELFLFVNDAMVPFTAPRWREYDYRYFYQASGSGQADERGNRGTACVVIESADATRGTFAAPSAGPICEQAFRRSSGQTVTALNASPAHASLQRR